MGRVKESEETIVVSRYHFDRLVEKCERYDKLLEILKGDL